MIVKGVASGSVFETPELIAQSLIAAGVVTEHMPAAAPRRPTAKSSTKKKRGDDDGAAGSGDND